MSQGLKNSVGLARHHVEGELIKKHKELYYIHKKGRKPGGNLYSKYHNAISRLRKDGVLEFESKDNSVKDSILNVEPIIIDQNEISDKEWLKFNIDPMDEVSGKWKNTQRMRISYIRSDNSLKEILDEWPLYKQSFGNKLILADFDHIFPAKESLLFVKWENFCNPILMLIERQVKDAQSKEMLKDLNSQFSFDKRNCVILYLLHSLIKPTNRKCIVDKVTRKRKYTKSSITDSRNAFLLWAPTSVELTTKIKFLIDNLAIKKETLQPVICAIGSSILDLNEFFVYYANTFYKIDNIISSVDVAFKLFNVLNSKYPDNCKSVWLFIQSYFYEIPLNNSEKSALLVSVINELKCLEQ